MEGANGCEGRAADVFEPAFSEMSRGTALKAGDAMRRLEDRATTTGGGAAGGAGAMGRCDNR